MRRIIVIGLDGYDPAYAARLMAAGELPALRAMREHGVAFDLDHGADREAGLPWEQFATGLSTADGGRASAVRFDRESFESTQPATHLSPFAAALGLPTLAFDMPGFSMERTPNARGVIGWGVHAAAVDGQIERPEGLLAEIRDRFGDYPAEHDIYTIVWNDRDVADRVAREFLEGMRLRTDIALWLMKERLPDWQLAFVVASELHSAAEAFWHGVDGEGPLAALPSAPIAGAAMRDLYVAADRMVAEIRAAFPDDIVVALNMHGMGPNHSDVPSMALLPELLYRDTFGVEGGGKRDWPAGPAGIRLIPEGASWDSAVGASFAKPFPLALRAAAARPLLSRPADLWRIARARIADKRRRRRADDTSTLWMVPVRYRYCWPMMPAFALPSYHDGRVRVNLAGRERGGLVPPERYGATLDHLERLLGECTDPETGRPAVRAFTRPAPADPRGLDDMQVDLLVTWAGSPTGLDHPRLGRIGPFPMRRSGGHTGGHGAAIFAGPSIPAREGGLASSYDVVPTIVELLGRTGTARVSGTSLAERLRSGS